MASGRSSGGGTSGIADLMIEIRLLDLERGGHVEDLLAVLNRHHAAAGETLTVAAAVDVIDNRRGAVAAPQKVGMQRVHHALRSHGRRRRPQRLTQHLAAKHLRAADVLALPAEKIDLQGLELEHPQKIVYARVSGGQDANGSLRVSLDDEVAVHERVVPREGAQILIAWPFFKAEVAKVTVADSPPPTTLVCAITRASPCFT
jgi:hypothetical protein